MTHVGVELDARARLAMLWEIVCSEPWARYGVAATETCEQGHLPRRHAVAGMRDLFRQVCAGVPPGVVPPGSDQPPRSNVPVLFLAGADDPVDPPANLARPASTSSRTAGCWSSPLPATAWSQDGCFALVVAQFVERRSVRGLDLGCLEGPAPEARSRWSP